MHKFRSTQLSVLALASLLVAPACSREPATETTGTEPAANMQHSDDEITTAVQAGFYAEPELRDARIDVATDNNVVTLSGTVPSEQTRQRALERARGVEGVMRVEDRMAIAVAGAPDASTRHAAGGSEQPETSRTPGWITTKIQAQYFTTPSIKPWNIDVTTGSNGAVTLEGEVDTVAAKDEALRIARTTEGVARVEDRLRVSAGEPAATTGVGDASSAMSDAWLTTRVQSKYYMDDAVRARDIDVMTDDGAVTLQGTVNTAEERRRAVALARNTDGVRAVTDQLQVQPKQPAESTTGASTRGSGAARVAAGIEDAWITTKIQSQYFLDPDVKSHEIDVDTRDGVVTLQGSVETAARQQQAEQIARDTEGVRRVVNQLTIEARQQP
jgi:hyperosmotically inducible protein